MSKEKLKVLDLFSGIGGFSLGLERTGGFETVAFCEIDPFCQKILNKHFPDVPVYNDVRSLNYGDSVDVITGGFPCQPYSTASRGRKVAECLWYAQEEIILKLNPKIVICENVQRGAIKNAQKFAESIGYSTAVRNISAAKAGAWHRRNRWWLIAHPYDKSEFLCTLNAEVGKLPELCNNIWVAEAYSEAVRISNGVSRGLDGHRLKALGNTVIPQIPEIIGNAILKAEN